MYSLPSPPVKCGPDAHAPKAGNPPAQRAIQCIGTPLSIDVFARSNSALDFGCSAMKRASSRRVNCASRSRLIVVFEESAVRDAVGVVVEIVTDAPVPL